jgi:DNA-directed RNA polymerase beta' subunit
MGGINNSHTDILVDRMTFSGTINSISRYTLKTENSSVLGKASFEESLENFLQASIAGTLDTTTGNSASIVCGKKSRAGTGFVSLKVDLDAIRNNASE